MLSPVRFDCFEVDSAAGRLFKRGVRVHVREQSLQVLLTLLERPGEPVTREELRRRLWPSGVFVDFENSLNTAVARLREALGDSAEHPRFIETLPKRGYRFVGRISPADDVVCSTPPGRVRLLVLPFVNLTGDAAHDHLADAMTDEVITALAALAPDALAVIARTTAMRYRGLQKDVAQIGRELGVDQIVEGAVRSVADSMAATVQLVRASDQAHVWAKRYDASSGSLFDVPGLAAVAIAAAVGAGTRPARRETGRAPAMRWAARNPAAYGECVQGLREIDRSSPFPSSISRARAHFETALACDPEYAPAHEGLARLYWMVGYVGIMSPHEAVAAGMPHVVRALELDPARAETRALTAQYYKQLDYNWPDIEQELRRAREMDPASSLVRMLHAIGWLMPQGHVREAIVELGHALERDPLSFEVHYWLTVMLALAREWDHVVEHARLLAESEQESPFGPWLLSVGLRGQGRNDEALREARRAASLAGESAMMLGWLGLHLGTNGLTDEGRALLDRLAAMARTSYVPPCCFAWISLGLRDLDATFEWLGRAVDARDQFLMPIKSYAFLDPIRSDPRFAALLRKMKLEP